jgi:hypothetical protein
VGNHAEGHQIAVGNGLLEWIVGGGQLVVAAEKLTGAAADHFYRRGSQTDLQGVEVLEEVAIEVVDGPVRLVGDDQIEEADVEGLVVVDQPLVDADVDAGVQFADVVWLDR